MGGYAQNEAQFGSMEDSKDMTAVSASVSAEDRRSEDGRTGPGSAFRGEPLTNALFSFNYWVSGWRNPPRDETGTRRPRDCRGQGGQSSRTVPRRGVVGGQTTFRRAQSG